MQKEFYDLGSVIEAWLQSHSMDQDQSNREKYLSLALRLYVLPVLDSTTEGINRLDFASYCDSFSVGRLEKALEIFDAEFENAVLQGKTAKTTGKNYRSALKNFLLWVEMQPWWAGLCESKSIKVIPKRKKLTPMPKKIKGVSIAYSLKKEDLPDNVAKELADFREFRISGGLNLPRPVAPASRNNNSKFLRRPKLEPTKDSTFQNDENNILYFLGWYHANFPGMEYGLALLTDLDLLDDFVYWAIENRGVTHCIGVSLTKTAIAIAKWFNYNKTTRRNWSDIPLILELKSLKNEYSEEYNEEKKISDTQKWSQKELSHEDLRKVVDYLKSLCAENSPSKHKIRGAGRHKSAVLRSSQTHLLVKFLTYCPVREEEIQNLVFGKSLLRKENNKGTPYYVVRLTEHKRDKTKALRYYPLPSILTEDLDTWLFYLRPQVIESLQTLENWMSFWDYKLNILEVYKTKIENARKGILDKKTKSSPESYIETLEKKIKGIQYRLDSLICAKENMEKYDRVFFSFGKKDAMAFGSPLNNCLFWQTVRRATAIATYELFGEAKWINPHAFRNMAEKHLRLIGKGDQADAFGALIGHSKEMGDEYANQILSEYEITEDIVDNWWIEDFR